MEITISKACIYKDGRCHGVFTDGSGIILHKGGHYTTYFSPTGEITRQVTLCTVSGLKSKVLKLIQLCNSSLPSPIPIFSEEIYKLTSHDSKILSCTFSHLSQNPNTQVYKSLENSMSVSLNKTKTLIKLTFPYLLPHRKPSWTESSMNRVHLSYEYATLTQIFHVSNLPEHWHALLSLFTEEFSNESNEEFTVMFPTAQAGEIWKNDTISPAINIFSYLSDNVMWYWTPEGTYYIPLPSNVLTVIHEDQSLLEASGEFFTHIKEEGCLKFTSETVPVTVRNAKYKLQGFVKDSVDLLRLPNTFKPQENLQTEENEFIDGVKFENEVQGVGSFIAYNDKSIRVLFEDRTLIRIYPDFTVSALSRTGESARFTLENPFGFESYIPVCVEFYNWAFLSQTEQVKRINEAAERETIVNAEISRVERLSNKLPAQVIPEEISDSLLAAQKQLKETRELLNKINQV